MKSRYTQYLMEGMLKTAKFFIAFCIILLAFPNSTFSDCDLFQGNRLIPKNSELAWCIKMGHIAGGSSADELILKAQFPWDKEKEYSGCFLVDGEIVGIFENKGYSVSYWLRRNLKEGDIIKVGIKSTEKPIILNEFRVSMNPISVYDKDMKSKDVTACPTIVNCNEAKKCPKCARECTDPDYKFCPFCGAPLQ